MSTSTMSKRVAYVTSLDVDPSFEGSPFAHTLTAIAADDRNDWTLADCLLAEVAKGMDRARRIDFDPLLAELKAKGLNRSYNTLRQYRAAAAFWPVKDRVQGLPFTHHRRLQAAGDLSSAKAVLAKVLKAKGGNVADVAERDLVAAITGGSQAAKAATAKAAKAAGPVGPVATDDIGLSEPAIDRLIRQAQAITRDVLADVGDETLTKAAHVLAETIKRIEHVQAMRTKAAARQSAKATNVTKATTTKAATTTTTKAANTKAAKVPTGSMR